MNFFTYLDGDLGYEAVFVLALAGLLCQDISALCSVVSMFLEERFCRSENLIHVAVGFHTLN